MLDSHLIRRLRKAQGLTQRELGKRCGVSKQAVCNWEAGRNEDIGVLQAYPLAKTLGIEMRRLLRE